MSKDCESEMKTAKQTMKNLDKKGNGKQSISPVDFARKNGIPVEWLQKFDSCDSFRLNDFVSVFP